ncbi:hypothetical protein BST81_00860 [Leptolyngbya sp. 'hensonii']|uniref:hypothetical protein n=1 Tax=Leptolyngbya sp. 'hensonii' TaxID=1922337 RepID=UPI00094FD9B5|nr:hypothetical protein [Leptolyngbya sp. 'hensonii']OLP20320.1 hypothetical protein BST81_00860 [Leptolyngbya sp. 'hensonii']
MCALIAAAIMIGAAIATRYRFPPSVRQPATPPSPFLPGLRSLANSKPVKAMTETTNQQAGGTGSRPPTRSGSEQANSEEIPPSSSGLETDQAGVSADKAYSTVNHGGTQQLW